MQMSKMLAAGPLSGNITIGWVCPSLPTSSKQLGQESVKTLMLIWQENQIVFYVKKLSVENGESELLQLVSCHSQDICKFPGHVLSFPTLPKLNSKRRVVHNVTS